MMQKVKLSIDCSGQNASFIFTDQNNKPVSDLFFDSSDRLLFKVLPSALKENNIAIENISLISWGQGPGSFTGTRVASSVIQAIAFTNNIPVIGISSMWLMAFQASRIKKLDKYCCVKHAYGEMIYISYFSSPLDKNNITVKLIKKNELSIKDDENVIIEDNALVKMLNLQHPNIINLSDHKKRLDATSQIEALESNDYKEKNFNLKTTIPDYADHEV